MNMQKSEIAIPVGDLSIYGDLTLIDNSKGIVVFAHGSGSSRFSSRNQHVAHILNAAHFSTLLFDLLTEKEERIDVYSREFRFNIPLLAKRLVSVSQWLQTHAITKHLKIGYFGASTGAAAALIAAAELKTEIAAVVSRGGRPDLAHDYLAAVCAPTLLIVGALDYEVITLNEQAYKLLTHEKKMVLIPGATHLFEEPGTLEEVALITTEWFKKYMA